MLIAFLGFTASLMAQAPSIQTITPPASPVLAQEKAEFRLDLSATYANPYDYRQVHLWAEMVGPAGDTLQVDGFYLRPYTGPAPVGLVSLSGPGEFRLRFAPPEAGDWRYRFHLRDNLGQVSSGWDSLTVQAGTSAGWVRSSTQGYLQFDDGQPFVPIGQNIGWSTGNAFQDYRLWLGRMTAEGANFFRIWSCDWGLSLEWQGGSYAGLGQYQQQNAAYFDWLFDYGQAEGVYAMFCLQHHGQVSTTVNPRWSQSPYNQANGGMCANPWEFFTHPEARAYTRNRFRYLVARYGYARSLMAWELFNEVDWTDDYDLHQAAVADWIDEMSTFLKEIDPYQHLVSTSFARDRYDPAVWTLPSIDLTQTHYYAAIPNLERTLAQGIRRYRDLYDKPTLTGEFGIRTSGSNLSHEDPDGIHFHNSLWGSFFAGGLGTGLSWWWDTYLHPQDLYHHYGPLAERIEGLPLLADDYQPAAYRIEQAPGNLVLTPNQGWAGTVNDTIVIEVDGSTQPEAYALGEFLYGAQWNLQFRNPPTFVVDYPTAGHFSVRTGANTGQSPRLVIRIDGSEVLNAAAAVNRTYSVAVPVGSHHISVSNQGTDWITVAGYTFEGLGSALDAYLLKAENGQALAGWLLNHQYNHVQLQTGPPPVVSRAELVMPGMSAGSYFAKWYDCLTGALVSSANVAPVDDTLRLAVPDVTWDLALVVDDQAVTNLPQTKQFLTIRAYPNPWGQVPLTVDFPSEGSGPCRLTLLDVAGRQVVDLSEIDAAGELILDRPTGLAPGIYWLKVTQGDAVGTVALRVE